MLSITIEVLVASLLFALPFKDVGKDVRAPAVCGNGVVEKKEQCDGNQLSFKFCEDFDPEVYAAGVLACDDSCQFDESKCSSGDCCRDRNTAECEAPEITECVCKFDPFCCEVEWDFICVDEVIAECGAVCS